MISHFFSKKKAPNQSPTSLRRRSSGFALMIALGLMSFVLLIILGLSTLVQVNSKIVSSEKNLTTAKQNALFALNLAIGDLQNEMGPDQRISATASILDEFPETEEIDGVNNPYWTGAWNSNDPLDDIKVNQVVSTNRIASDGKPSHFRKWLVSTPINDKYALPEESIALAKNFSKESKDAILMVGPGTVGEEATAESSVYAPRQIINKELENENGYAYWVGDEGVKARVAGAQAKEINNDLDQILNVNNAGTPRLNAIDGFTELEDISDQSDKILTMGTAQVVLKEALAGNLDAFKNKFHSLSAFSRGLMVDVKHGGVRKDLSLLFASDSLPIEYEDEPMFDYDSSLGPTWNYALRYHNIYKRIRNNGARNYLNTSDFWPDAETKIGPTETKYADIPVPVLARMQLIFTLHRQMNTFNGRNNEELAEFEESQDNSESTGFRNIVLDEKDDWKINGDATIAETFLDLGFTKIPLGVAFTVNDSSDDTYFSQAEYFTTSGQFPLEFIEREGSVYIIRNDDDGQPTVSGYVEFIGSNLKTDSKVSVTEDFTLGPNGPKGKIALSIPITPNVSFEEFRLHFNEDAVGVPMKILSAAIEADVFPRIAKPQSTKEDILHLMMTPIFYLWNPYNVEIVMDEDPEKKENRGAYEYFYTPPDIEFTFDGREWISLKKFGTFQFGIGGELFNMWSSNNINNHLTKGKPFQIPAGEFRYNITIPPPNSIEFDPEQNKIDPYLRMQFFNVKSNTKYFNLFSSNNFNYSQFNNADYEPAIANWVESTNDMENHQHTGVFSPVINYQDRGGAGLSPDGSPSRPADPSYKKVVYNDDVYKFGLRLKNQAFTSKLSLGGGWATSDPSYSTNGPGPIHKSRFIGALNLDTHFKPSDYFDPSPYHKSESKLITIPAGSDGNGMLKYIRKGDEFVGIQDSQKIAVNIDIRGFSEEGTPGKHAFFIDPANNYYYDDDESDTNLALAPFRIYITEIENSQLIQLDANSDNPSTIIFKTMAGDEISKCVAKELPLIPLLSIAQLDHAPLGRDYDHFAYFHGRQLQGDNLNAALNNLQSYSLLGDHSRGDAVFKGKDPRKMAPSFNMAVGNSWAHPTIPLNDIIEIEGVYEGFATDRSYLLNETLFDSYFFTGLAYPSGPFSDEMKELSQQLYDWISQEGTLMNTNYNFKVPNSMTQKEVFDTISYSNVDTIDLFDKIANFIEIEGAFNINSTSVDSWAAQLTSLRGKSVLYDNSGYGAYNIDNTNTENTPVLSQTIPAEKSLENAGGTKDQILKNSWSHYRSLEDAQLYKLAEEIVKQIKARGPFLSLSQFFNREISERKPYNIKGAMQTAIDESLLNIESTNENVGIALAERFQRDEGNQNWIGKSTFTSPEIFEGGSNEGLPGYITQSSILRPLCPILSARSDTFIIRAYGDSKINGKTQSRAWCEAIVQRRIDLIDEKNQLNPRTDKSDPNAFNRKFEIVSFRWLNADEI